MIRLYEDVVQGFLAAIGPNPTLAIAAKSQCGYEAWVKFELYRWAHERFFPDATSLDWERLRIESCEDLAPIPEQDKTQKLVDFRLSANPGGEARPFHFLEMKVVFDNEHREKMARSAGEDLWYLSSLQAECTPATVAALIFVGGTQPVLIDTVIRDCCDAARPVTSSVEYASQMRVEKTRVGEDITAVYLERPWTPLL